MKDNLSPIILFIYNRPDHTRQTLEALSANTLAKESDLFIYADGAKENASSEQLKKIRETRELARSNAWCKSVTVIESEKNKGLAASIISGVTEIVNRYGKVIVLEDDIVTGKYFLEFMNTALEKYADEKNVWHITGWRDPVKKASADGSYFYPTMDCWGWATWSDRWQHFKKDALYYKSIFTPQMIWEFNIEGSDEGMWSQIEDNISGKINTWAIFWYATIFLQKGLCLAPMKSLVKNVGFDNSGVHCGTNPAQTITDSIDWRIADYPEKIEINRKEFEKNKYFLHKMHGTLPRQKCMRMIKNMIKSILRPPYHAVKRIFGY